MDRRAIGRRIAHSSPPLACVGSSFHPFATMPAVTRRLLLESLSSLPLLSATLLAASQRADAKQAATTVYELRVYHAAPRKLGELLARFRDHTAKLFAKHGIKGYCLLDPGRRTRKGQYACVHSSAS